MTENVGSAGDPDKGDDGEARASEDPHTDHAADDETLACNAIRAISILAARVGTPAASAASMVALRAIFALALPEAQSNARVVETMDRARHGADKRADRYVIYLVETAVRAALVIRRDRPHPWPSTSEGAPSWLRARLAVQWPEQAERLTEDDLAAWLDALVAGRFQASGVIARILVVMRWFGTSTIERVTKRVSEALRAKRDRSRGKRDGGSPRPRVKRRRSTRRATKTTGN